MNNAFPLIVNVGTGKFFVDCEGQIGEYDKEFIEKEYLKSAGTQYIDTGYNATGNTKVDIKFQFENNNSIATVFGARKLNVSNYILVDASRWDNLLYYYYGSYSRSSQDIEFGKTYSAYCSNSKAIVSEFETIGNDTYVNFSMEYPLYLFAINESGIASSFGKDVRIYYCKIYEGDALVRDFIPVVSLENGHENEPCLYDKVEGKFYYNQGTGTFVTN